MWPRLLTWATESEMLSLGCFPPRARVFSGTSACVDETGGNQAVSDHGTEAGSPLGRGFWAWRQPGETGQDFLDCGFRVTPRLSPGAWQGDPGRACLALGRPSTNAQAASRVSDRKGQGAPPPPEGAPPHPRAPVGARGCLAPGRSPDSEAPSGSGHCGYSRSPSASWSGTSLRSTAWVAQTESALFSSTSPS